MAKIRYESGEQDGATAVAHEFDSKASLTTAGAKILSVKNAGVEKLAIDKSGNILSAGANNIWTVRPEEGGAGIQTALNSAKAARGGIVQLLAGTYTISSLLGVYTYDSSGAMTITLQGVGDETIISLPNGMYMGDIGGVVLNGTTINSASIGATSVFIKTPNEALAANVKTGDIIIPWTDDAVITSIYYNDYGIAAADGNGTTGEIQLKSPLNRAFDGTVPRIYVQRGGRFALKNMKIQYTGSSFISRLIGIYTNDTLIENVTFDGNSKAAGLSLANGVNNIVRNCRFLNIGDSVSGYTSLSLYNLIDATIENCLLRNCRTASVIGIGGGSTRSNITNNILENCANYVIAHDAYGGRDHIIHGNKVISAEYTAIYFSTHTPNLIITDNYIYNSGANGIVVYTENAVISGNTIIHTGYAHGGNGYGIILEGATPDYALRCVVSSNNIHDCASGGYGIYVAGKYLSITDNTLSNTGSRGIEVDYCYNTVVSNNSIYNNSSTNIEVMRGSNVSVVGNSCKKGGTYNIDFNGGTSVTPNSLISNNVCDGDSATSYGIISASGSPYNSKMTISGNIIRNTTSTSLLIYADESIIYGNNADNGISITGTGTISGLNKE